MERCVRIQAIRVAQKKLHAVATARQLNSPEIIVRTRLSKKLMLPILFQKVFAACKENRTFAKLLHARLDVWMAAVLATFTGQARGFQRACGMMYRTQAARF
jgi:hypothetical protein